MRVEYLVFGIIVLVIGIQFVNAASQGSYRSLLSCNSDAECLVVYVANDSILRNNDSMVYPYKGGIACLSKSYYRDNKEIAKLDSPDEEIPLPPFFAEQYCGCARNFSGNGKNYCAIIPYGAPPCYGCGKEDKVFNLSDGRRTEIKIMPETASERAIERLGELGFNVSLKEVGKGNESRAVYEVVGEKQGKMLGLFKVRGKVSAEVDAETGEVIKTHKPWWAFLASGI